MRAKKAPLRLWTPAGEHDLTTAPARRVVEQYDENLMLARNVDTGDWCVYLKPRANPFGQTDKPFPVIGLGPELPSPETIQRRLYQADAKRRGDQILNDMNSHNESLMQPKRIAADTGTGIAAEVFEYGFRKMGAHPIPRVFVPRSV